MRVAPYAVTQVCRRRECSFHVLHFDSRCSDRLVARDSRPERAGVVWTLEAEVKCFSSDLHDADEAAFLPLEPVDIHG